jgi:eukaryotic-like serine/threonine-protein kinase
MARALGRYELLRPLARGGMAEVYLARRRAAGVEKWLVVKRMRQERTGDATFLELFMREARLSMSLVHQNIVPVFDFGKIDDQVFLAMERVEGKDLGSSLARAPGHRIPPLLAAFIAAECCQALDYAHQRKSPEGVALGVVHRDVTPRNVLLSWSGEVKLTDFGIAALAGDATNRLLGTPQYMAPEQARSEPTDPRADIYAVGLVLREAITGVRPRPGGEREAILEAARRGELLPWPHLAGAAGRAGTADDDVPAAEPPPPELVAIVDRAIALAPADRFPDARSMLAALDSFIVGERAAHKAEPPARQLGAWLASVWEGARDDVETDASIEGDHLVSFLDDGGLDLLGTGTVRSLAATAAEDGQPPPPPGEPLAPATPGALAPAIVRSGAPAPPRPGTTPGLIAAQVARVSGRSGRISSSNATVASGSFEAIPVSEHDLALAPRRGASRPPAQARPLAPRAAILVLGVAVGAALVYLLGTRGAAPPGDAPQLAGAAIDAEPPPDATREPPPDAAREPPPDAAREPPPDAARAPDRPDASRPRSEPSRPDRPASGQPPPAPPAASDGRSDASAAPPDRPRAAVCRVRINLTPWAYFTVDGEPTQHETPSTIDLTPGPHRLRVWNPELAVEREITIHVPADRDTMTFSEPLQASPSRIDAGPP